ncbi:hypothetical protein DOK76_06895 [Vagococcus sp. DIV0080]|uniref:Lipoprotein n=1 Tax=Candidatus Vagococcus giribetii TaxID=2230876 RepID=A0ABS3HSU6_9ENTE|nr:hypothetical protein [Vagococcus sp. DIV0080]MBO0476790.1 hypothetical protein [Vagococcus sp. DIV0080]
MKIGKLLFLPLLFLMLSECSSKKDNAIESSTQMNPKEESTNTTSQTREINIDFICGEWQSINEDDDYYMVIDKINDKTIKYSDNLERKGSQELTIEEVSKDSVTALTKDEKNRYIFIYSKNDTLTSFFGVNSSYYSDKGEKAPEGLSKPIEYSLLLKCGTEEVLNGGVKR